MSLLKEKCSRSQPAEEKRKDARNSPEKHAFANLGSICTFPLTVRKYSAQWLRKMIFFGDKKLTPRRVADDHQSDHRDDIFKCAIAQQIDTL